MQRKQPDIVIESQNVQRQLALGQLALTCDRSPGPMKEVSGDAEVLL